MRSARVLRRSLGIMAFMPLVTMPVVVLVGLYGVRRFDGELGEIGADQVMPMLLRGGMAFWAALGASGLMTVALYGLVVFVASRFGIQL